MKKQAPALFSCFMKGENCAPFSGFPPEKQVPVEYEASAASRRTECVNLLRLADPYNGGYAARSPMRDHMAAEQPRKKSPRAPSIALDEALDRAFRIYDKERLHPAPSDVVAQHMGYKSANNGNALSALASLRYYGLLERPKEGLFAVTKDVEAYRFAPSDELKRSFLVRFLSSPPLFAELLDRYQSGLPSDGNMRYELIQRGFLPATAESVVGVFKKSVAFAGLFDARAEVLSEPAEDEVADGLSEDAAPPPAPPPAPSSQIIQAAPSATSPVHAALEEAGHDRIPVRLTGGRRAWLVIPSVLYEADKQRLKAQIDLILTQEDEL